MRVLLDLGRGSRGGDGLEDDFAKRIGILIALLLLFNIFAPGF